MMQINEDDFPTFQIKSYGKAELAAIYLPRVSVLSAKKTFRGWIAHHPTLLSELKATGLHNKSKIYTPLQVKLIISAFGEPG